MSVGTATKKLLAQRSRGLCEVCGWFRATNVHHRRPRQMGGSQLPGIDAITNLLHVCGQGNVSGCHGTTESWRAIAYGYGRLVHSWADPAETPVKLAVGWVRLTPDGGYEHIRRTPDGGYERIRRET